VIHCGINHVIQCKSPPPPSVPPSAAAPLLLFLPCILLSQQTSDPISSVNSHTIPTFLESIQGKAMHVRFKEKQCTTWRTTSYRFAVTQVNISDGLPPVCEQNQRNPKSNPMPFRILTNGLAMVRSWASRSAWRHVCSTSETTRDLTRRRGSN
jgi:hypothetical protein